MSAYVLLNLLNELRKKDKMQALQIFICFSATDACISHKTGIISTMQS